MTPSIPTLSADSRIPMLAYRPGRDTACPACGERQWLVGRIMAECAFCETALPIDRSHRGWTVVVSRERQQPLPFSPA